MRVDIVNVTPQKAMEWLAFNTSNRPLRRGAVEGLKEAFLRGEYISTHQGIAFSEDGELLDGQHRLTAISELRDGVFPMAVAIGVPKNAYMVTDIGLKRSPADALRLDDRRLVEVARLIASICSTTKGKPTPTSLLPLIAAIDRAHTALTSFCPTSAQTWSAAPVRLAAVMLIMNGASEDYVKLIYRSMVLGDFDSMSKVAQSLYRAAVDGRVRARDGLDILARCLSVFDVRKASNSKLLVRDPGAATAEVRQQFGHLIAKAGENMEHEKKKAPIRAVTRVGAKSVLHLDSKRKTAQG
jgi:hypothetical protein